MEILPLIGKFNARQHSTAITRLKFQPISKLGEITKLIKASPIIRYLVNHEVSQVGRPDIVYSVTMNYFCHSVALTLVD